MTTVDVTTSLETLTCCHLGCGVLFAVPYWWNKKRKEDHSSWYCPNGHSQYFPEETEAERLRREKADLEKRLVSRGAELDRTRAELRDTIKKSSRAAKRVANGVCPCCNRSFANLRRHMSNKHPTYSEKPKTKKVRK